MMQRICRRNIASVTLRIKIAECIAFVEQRSFLRMATGQWLLHFRFLKIFVIDEQRFLTAPMRQQSARNFWMEWRSHVMTKVQLASFSLQSKTIFQKLDFWSILPPKERKIWDFAPRILFRGFCSLFFVLRFLHFGSRSSVLALWFSLLGSWTCCKVARLHGNLEHW